MLHLYTHSPSGELSGIRAGWGISSTIDSRLHLQVGEESMTNIVLDLRVWFKLRPARSFGICARRFDKGLHSSHLSTDPMVSICPAGHEF